MMPIAVCVSICGLAFMLGALTFRLSHTRNIPASEGGPTLPVLIGSWGLMLTGAIILLAGGIPQ